MLGRLLIQWGLTAVAYGITSWLLPGMSVSGGFGAYLWVSLLFGLVNAVVGTILRLLTLPLVVITLGLVFLVVNAIVLEITDALTSHLTIDDFFWTAIWAAIILSLVSVTVNFFIWLARSPD
jgi:putative membrane protein